MTATAPLVIDAYAGLAHKQIVGRAGQTSTTSTYTPSWVSPADRRRLAAYLVRDAYRRNVARWVLPDATSTDEVAGHREYGDVAVMVDRLRAAVLGDDWSIEAAGADDDLLAGPDLPERPEDPASDDPLVRRIHAGRVAAWELEAVAAVDAWEQALAAQPLARSQQAAVRAWAERSQLAARLHEAEGDAVGLGDGVLAFWPQANDWPMVTAHDPGFYFPEVTAGSVGGFPDVHHLAWVYEDVIDGKVERLVRRMTWRFVEVAALRVADGEWTALAEGEEITPDGRVSRAFPWGPGNQTCTFYDAVWREGDLLATNEAHRNVDPFATAPYRVNVPLTDLGVDTVPLVHLPNTPSGQELFGQAAVDQVAQVVDDVAQVDNLTISAASYIGDPTMSVSGVQPGADSVVMPGKVFGLGENGRMDVLDLSGGVEKLMALGETLRDVLWQNAGIPREVVGRGQVDNLSGVALALKLAPFAQLVAAMRIGREPKDRLIPRIALKMAMVAGVVEPGPLAEVRLVRGSFLPTDKAATVTMVADALEAHAISLQTAVALLIGAGLPITDAQAEVERIKAEWPAAAKDVAEATASEALAAEWLGVELPAAAPLAPPTIVLPE